MQYESRSTFLLSWNPKKWEWENLTDDISTFETYGFLTGTWSIGNTRKIHKGDRIFLIRLGVEPRGIVASGYVTSEAFEEEHWNESKGAEGKAARYIAVEWDELLNAETDPILLKENLVHRVSDTFRWEIQSSGIEIPHDAAGRLEEEWARLISRRRDLNGDSVGER